LNWQIARPGALENLVYVGGCAVIQLGIILAIAHQASGFHLKHAPEHRRQAGLCGESRDLTCLREENRVGRYDDRVCPIPTHPGKSALDLLRSVSLDRHYLDADSLRGGLDTLQYWLMSRVVRIHENGDAGQRRHHYSQQLEILRAQVDGNIGQA